MKICLQEGLLPGASLNERLDFAESLNVEGLEISSRSASSHITEYEKALNGRQIKLVAICGNPTFNFLNPDRKLREESIALSKINLDVIGHFGGVGQIVPPIFGPPVVPDLAPLFDPIELEYKMMTPIAQELAAYAAERGTNFLLEPLNRYEQHFLKTQAEGARVIEEAGSPAGIGLLSDFFHMHIEETSTPDALRKYGKYTKHVHMADNTRKEPGSGDIDFTAGLQALKDISYDGYLSWECGLSGDPKEALTNSVKFVRDILQKIGA
ncbi:MAG: sugar phosphate isomerase/epimerase [Abditibacteriaceae bacterium]